MSDTVTAIVTRPRGFTAGGGRHRDGEVIRDLPANQFEDWRGMGWVDRATAEQIAAADEAEAKAIAAAKTTKSKARKTA